MCAPNLQNKNWVISSAFGTTHTKDRRPSNKTAPLRDTSGVKGDSGENSPPLKTLVQKNSQGNRVRDATGRHSPSPPISPIVAPPAPRKTPPSTGRDPSAAQNIGIRREVISLTLRSQTSIDRTLLSSNDECVVSYRSERGCTKTTNPNGGRSRRSERLAAPGRLERRWSWGANRGKKEPVMKSEGNAGNKEPRTGKHLRSSKMRWWSRR